MAYSLFITQNAADELAGIVDYIANHLDNPKAAADFLDRVEECYERLAENPKIYQLCDYQDFKEKGYRKVIIKNYVLFSGSMKILTQCIFFMYSLADRITIQ